MPDLTIKPTTKFIKAGVMLAGIAAVALEIAYLVFLGLAAAPWVMIIPLLLFLWPAVRAMRRRFTTTTVIGDRMRYETGITTKSTRTIQLSKIQDVRVDQRLIQRFWNIGDLSIETAGESSRLTIRNVDHPQALADELMNRVQRGPVVG